MAQAIETGEDFTPAKFVREALQILGDVTPDRISIGYPGLVRWSRPAEEPSNLGQGWIGYDFAQAFGRPVRIMNDAEMQALGVNYLRTCDWALREGVIIDYLHLH